MTQQPADAMPEPLNCPFCDGPGRKRTGLTCQVWCYNCNFHAEFSVWQRRHPQLSVETVEKIREALEHFQMFIGHPNPDKREKKDCELRAKASAALALLPSKPTDDGGKS